MSNQTIQQTGIKLEQLNRELRQFGNHLKDFEQFLLDNNIKRWATIDQFGQFWYEEGTARVPFRRLGKYLRGECKNKFSLIFA